MLAILPLSIELSDSSGVLRAPHQKDQASNPPLPSSPAWTTGSTTAHSPPITTFSHISYQLLQPNNSRGRRIHLLTLPLEVRLLIYHHLLSLTPMWPRDLSGPSHPLPHHGSGQPQHDGTTYLLLRPRLPGLHPPYPHDPHAVPSAAGYLPSSLLCTNRQIYNEARLVPFHHNEFAFVSWFFSGLSAARAFVARLAGWQRDGLRFARLEKVLAADLVEEGRVRMWEELCGFWENGLQRLRLKIELGPVKMEQEVWNRDEEGWSCPTSCRQGEREDASWKWVDVGLRRLRGLKALDVEFAGEGGEKGKNDWCLRLSERLNQGRDERKKIAVLQSSG